MDRILKVRFIKSSLVVNTTTKTIIVGIIELVDNRTIFTVINLANLPRPLANVMQHHLLNHLIYILGEFEHGLISV